MKKNSKIYIPSSSGITIDYRKKFNIMSKFLDILSVFIILVPLLIFSCFIISIVIQEPLMSFLPHCLIGLLLLLWAFDRVDST